MGCKSGDQLREIRTPVIEIAHSRSLWFDGCAQLQWILCSPEAGPAFYTAHNSHMRQRDRRTKTNALLEKQGRVQEVHGTLQMHVRCYVDRNMFHIRTHLVAAQNGVILNSQIISCFVWMFIWSASYSWKGARNQSHYCSLVYQHMVLFIRPLSQPSQIGDVLTAEADDL